MEDQIIMPEAQSETTNNEDKVVQPVISKEKKPSRVTKPKDAPIVGLITERIGSGEHAKESFVWVTITWSFVIGTSITAIILLRTWCDGATATITIDSVKAIWTIFVPLITLALGYSFGKGK